MIFLFSYTLAILIDAAFGDPDWVYSRLWHPVVWFGKFITRLERILYPESRNPKQEYRAGFQLVVRLIAVVGIGAVTLHLRLSPSGETHRERTQPPPATGR